MDYRQKIKRVDLSLDSLPKNLDATLKYWESISNAENSRPRWKDFDLTMVPTSLLSTTMVYEIREPHIESIYRFWGTGMTMLYGKDYTGLPISSLVPSISREPLAAALSIVCKSKSPSAHTPHFTNNFGAVERQCVLRLPIFDTPGEVTKIVTLIDSSHEAMDAFQKAIGEMIIQDTPTDSRP